MRQRHASAVTADPRDRRHRRRRAVVVTLAVAGVLAAAVFGGARLLAQRSTTARSIAWMESDTGDRLRFPSRVIAAGAETSALRRGNEPPVLRQPVGPNGEGGSLDDFLARTSTTAFLVLDGDAVVYERYFGGADRDTQVTSFSSAKSVLSTLVGIAIDEGFIGGVEDPITEYVPELAERDSRFADITLRNLLTMSSGIAYTEEGMPWSDDAVTYYGVDLREVATERTHISGEPGAEWHYNNFNPLLLGLVLERSTGMSVSDFMSTRLWQPLGAESDASWSLDSTRSGFEKMESGINARPIDFARFGAMMLHDGRWNGRQIVSRDWVREATAVDVASDPADFYQYFWWVRPNPGADADGDPFFALGKYGQMIGVFPEQDLVIVRFGDDTGGVDWREFLTETAERIAANAH